MIGRRYARVTNVGPWLPLVTVWDG
jgi:hypothetical protein